MFTRVKHRSRHNLRLVKMLARSINGEHSPRLFHIQPFLFSSRRLCEEHESPQSLSGSASENSEKADLFMPKSANFTTKGTICPEVPALLASLAQRNIKISTLSGDHPAAVQRIAATLFILRGHDTSQLLPAARYIRALLARGARVLFCGDGTNDSVVLAQADIGVHMPSKASGTGAADSMLIRPLLNGIRAPRLSDVVHRRIVLNFAWAVFENTVAILFTAGAFLDAHWRTQSWKIS
ncbi:hypothetical protein PHLGIDRAFT_121104 [Phlebiopsis gigantea 11061_1 CR5-6]|uniref:Cation-transporting P-type ATPase C-terminal domain-containing protein n=1 Tax=Phlebiopsis gigantea (strain 11061_1 CR5-6) TaxID=745531 RepID=A0A0C3PER9_PHLG1|nr:hypothetical protein PHLGIDRAFT_121104 [Phlebiopsis gigantea 11061_1 CR5-6]